jgi:hypothetical protein
MLLLAFLDLLCNAPVAGLLKQQNKPKQEPETARDHRVIS